jgi:octaprenyl-diphosphate synthase
MENKQLQNMTEGSTFLDQFNPYFERIEQELGKVLTSNISLIEEVAQYSLLGNGKRLRPLFFILSCQLCDYDKHDAFTLSTIFECLHAASLLHDDVIDNATIRRGKVSVNERWGSPAAILVGDFLFSKFSRMIIEKKHIELLKVLADTATRMTEGQVLELINTHNWNLTRKEYMGIITDKTAALISAACAGGGIVAGAEETHIRSLRNFGLNMGIAFQIIDDVFDYTASAEETGKPTGSDLKEGKITLPLIYALTRITQMERDRLGDIFKSGKALESDYDEVASLVRSNGAIARCRRDAQGYVDRAAAYLRFFPDSLIKEGLLKLNQFIVTRSN